MIVKGIGVEDLHRILKKDLGHVVVLQIFFSFNVMI